MTLFNIDNYWPAVALAFTLAVIGSVAHSQPQTQSLVEHCDLEFTEELHELNNIIKSYISTIMMEDSQVAVKIILFGGVDVFSDRHTRNTIIPRVNLDDPSLPIDCETLEYNINLFNDESLANIRNSLFNEELNQ